MKHSTLKQFIALFGFVILLSACAGSPGDSATSNGNSALQANSNTQQPIAQGTPSDASPSVAPPAVQTIPPPPAVGPAQPLAKVDATPAKPSPAANARLPKLIAPAKRLEFGKQPQDKTLVRAIVIKNGGSANLNVESVTPS